MIWPATGAELSAAAIALVGAPFRLHGRDPRYGLDCLGVVSSAMGRIEGVPSLYPLRGGSIGEIERLMREWGLVPAAPPFTSGDVLLLRPGPGQHHFAIAAGNDFFIHAHAGLRRVVLGPIPPDWPLTGHWRLPNMRT